MKSFPSGRGHSWRLKGQWTVFFGQVLAGGAQVNPSLGKELLTRWALAEISPMLALGRATDQWSWLRIQEY